MPWGFVAGAAIGAIGANMAANTQASAQEQAAGTQQQMFNTINQQEQPFIQGGYGAENALLYGLGIGGSGSSVVPLSSIMNPGIDPSSGYRINPDGSIGTAIAAPGMTATQGMTSGGVPLTSLITGRGFIPPAGLGYGFLTSQFTPQDFLNNVDPGYGFQLATGAQAVRNADTPGVGALSGPALKDLMSFNQGMASTGYQNAFNRFTTQQNNIFARLSQIAGLGQSAATQVGNSGTQLGTGIAQAQAGAGASQASGIVGATNSLGGSTIPLAYLLAGRGDSGVPADSPPEAGAGSDTGGM